MAANPVPLSELAVSTHIAPDESIITCSGRITSSTVTSLQNAVRGLLPGAKAIAIDFTNVTYMDSMGLGALVGLYVSAKRAGTKLRVINLNQRIKDLFSITHLAAVLVEGRDPEYINLP